MSRDAPLIFHSEGTPYTEFTSRMSDTPQPMSHIVKVNNAKPKVVRLIQQNKWDTLPLYGEGND